MRTVLVYVIFPCFNLKDNMQVFRSVVTMQKSSATFEISQKRSHLFGKHSAGLIGEIKFSKSIFFLKNYAGPTLILDAMAFMNICGNKHRFHCFYAV